MLYRFKSQATADLTMLQADGQTVLRLLGKDATRQGIITAEQLPQAIAALEAAAMADRALTVPPQDTEDEDGEPMEPSVGLTQRLAPFLQMLRLAQDAHKPVVWGV
ncbi:DUF1840 domain-containing protein [Hydrogenophaga sp. OTU3427]|uniref:DUF1840 domain-containing protein n=1 Tax=Hydrogenophaga sp. OTU3427 TaxID=3043856 RepID=UPI00313F0D77